jgi:hypothetical protein
MAKTFPSKFPSVCNCGCGESYPEGTDITRGVQGWVKLEHASQAQGAANEAQQRRIHHARKAAAEKARVRVVRQIVGGPDVKGLAEKLGVESASSQPDSLFDCRCGFLHRRDVTCL